ncbi:branched-chain-amino-acid transaminase [soil metagenome]
MGFGSEFVDQMAVSRFRDGAWSPAAMCPLTSLDMHPATHALHYSSACFEGLKAYRAPDGGVHIFRLDRHIERMRASARSLCLPVPDSEVLDTLICNLVSACRDEVPAPPGSLYLRPVLMGADLNIGGAATPATEALLYVLGSPVGDYFGDTSKALRLLVADCMRTAPGFGEVKTGGNYSAALRTVVAAKRQVGADQVLFCPAGDVQETGAANFLLVREGAVLTKPLDGNILAGVTRDSLLRLAGREGYRVEERNFGVDEMLEWIPDGEAAVSGTAAVLAGVGVLDHKGTEHRVGDGVIGSHTKRLRSLLTQIQMGAVADQFGWLRRI